MRGRESEAWRHPYLAALRQFLLDLLPRPSAAASVNPAPMAPAGGQRGEAGEERGKWRMVRKLGMHAPGAWLPARRAPSSSSPHLSRLPVPCSRQQPLLPHPRLRGQAPGGHSDPRRCLLWRAARVLGDRRRRAGAAGGRRACGARGGNTHVVSAARAGDRAAYGEPAGGGPKPVYPCLPATLRFVAAMCRAAPRHLSLAGAPPTSLPLRTCWRR